MTARAFSAAETDLVIRPIVGLGGIEHRYELRRIAGVPLTYVACRTCEVPLGQVNHVVEDPIDALRMLSEWMDEHAWPPISWRAADYEAVAS